MGGARSKGSKGVEDFKPYITRSIANPLLTQGITMEQNSSK